MKEYTLCALIASSGALIMDRVLGTHVVKRFMFWVFMGVMFGFKLLVNGYLTWRPIVLYGEAHYMGIRLGTIPLEDFLYGFSLLTFTVVFWEFYRAGTSIPGNKP